LRGLIRSCHCRSTLGRLVRADHGLEQSETDEQGGDGDEPHGLCDQARGNVKIQ
jgi:hypothetical protein